MQVITKLKRKMILTVLAIQAVVFAVVLGALNVALYKTGIDQTANFMRSFAFREAELEERKAPAPMERKNEFRVPKNLDRPKKEKGFSIRKNIQNIIGPPDVKRLSRSVFSVRVDAEKELFKVLSFFPLRYTEEELSLLVSAVVNLQDTNTPKYIVDSIGSFLYIKDSRGDSVLITFADYTKEIQVAIRLAVISAGIYLLALLISMVVAWFVAENSVKPVRKAFETQKQFVADAGHELKTPLAVIGANVDALAGEITGNKWIGYIKTEISRMDSLVSDLLFLAKNDSGRSPMVFAPFDLSRTVEATVLPFESIVFEQGKKLELEIGSQIKYVGDQRKIAQVVAILVDNAIKNTWKGGLVKISLSTVSSRRFSGLRLFERPVLEVYNQGEGLDKDEMQKVFQRFYRADSSRDRETGGSGLGLSIAQAIVRDHNGDITVKGQKGSWISFTAEFGKAGKM